MEVVRLGFEFAEGLQLQFRVGGEELIDGGSAALEGVVVIELHVPAGSTVQAPQAGVWQRHGAVRGCLRTPRQTLEPATEETLILCDRLRDRGIFMQPTGDHLNILKIKPPMCTTRASVDYFVESVERSLAQEL